MRTLSRLFQMVLLIALLSSTNAAYASSFKRPEPPSLLTELSKLEPFMTYERNGIFQSQAFNSNAAIKAGFSIEAVLTAREIVAYQNALANKARAAQTTDITSLDITLEKFPRLHRLYQALTDQSSVESASLDANAVILAAVNPCGDYNHPVPNSTPSWYNFTSSNPATTLKNWGFHNTSSYACGYGSCSSSDFTRGRSYTSSYGTCSSPRFRDQGRIVSATSFRIQYGEPNPEIFSYSWPYWNWGTYVQWWHSKY